MLLDAAERGAVWSQLERLIEDFIASIPEKPVVNEMTPPQVHQLLSGVDFSKPMSAAEALQLAADGMSRTHVQVSHPRYFGLFNPAPTTMGIAADALVAAMNPQLAAWKHSPFAGGGRAISDSRTRRTIRLRCARNRRHIRIRRLGGQSDRAAHGHDREISRMASARDALT